MPAREKSLPVSELTFLFAVPEPPSAIWHFPLETLSQSEEGYDIIHQRMCFLPHWKFALSGRKKFSLTIKLKAENVR
jgi:alpha-amylase